MKEYKIYPCQEWEESKYFTLLGSQKNPHTKLWYDFWLYHYYKDSVDMWSPTARHGLESHEYGSGPLCVVHHDKSHFGESFKKDYVWGIERANIIALYYIATAKRPYLLTENEYNLYKVGLL